MKKLKFGLALVTATLFASAAHAETYVIDGEGTIVTFTSSSWTKQNETTYTTLYSDEVAWNDPVKGWQYKTTGVTAKTSAAEATFKLPSLQEMQSSGGTGNNAVSWDFTYTVQAKKGWQLIGAGARGGVTGSYLEFAGGTVNAVGTVGLSLDGGEAETTGDDAVHTYKSGSTVGSLTTGSWVQAVEQIAGGNNFYGKYQHFYDSNGNETGYTVTQTIFNDLTPLTNVVGSIGLDLSVATTSFPQVAFMSGTPGTIEIYGHAVQSVSAVPEPSSYAMMAASLGLIGLLKRRKAKTPA